MKRLFETVLIVLFFSFLALLVPTSSNAKEKATTLRYSNFFPPTNRVSVLCEEWCKEVEKRTKGRVKVDYFPGAALTKPAQTYDGVIRGIADIGLTFCGYSRGRFPLSALFDLPLGIKTGYQGTKLANAYYNKFKPKEFDDVKILYFHTSPPHHLFGKRPVRTLEELKGLKIRAGGAVGEILSVLGAAAVSMPMSEAYDALAKGVVDGIETPFEPMKGFRLAEVVRYGTILEKFYAGLAFVVMNKRKWNGLPPDVRGIIEQINEEWIEKQGKLWDELEKEGTDFFLQKGGKIITLTKEENARFAQQVRPLLDDYVAKMRGKGLPGEEVLKFCVDYIKAH